MADVPAAFELAIEGAVLALEVAAAIVILFAGARALFSFLAQAVGRGSAVEAEERRFARALLLGLDFTIGSDVLKLAVSPTRDAVIVVGLVVLVRTALTLVLAYELSKAEKRDAHAEERDDRLAAEARRT